MLFPYIFGEKLDLTKFHKQAVHYISTMNEVSYHLYLPDYKISIETVGSNDKPQSHIITISISQLKRDQDYEVVGDDFIHPLTDSRFKEMQVIQEMFRTLGAGPHRGVFISDNVVSSVEKICSLVKTLHKINHLKAFI